MDRNREKKKEEEENQTERGLRSPTASGSRVGGLRNRSRPRPPTPGPGRVYSVLLLKPNDPLDSLLPPAGPPTGPHGLQQRIPKQKARVVVLDGWVCGSYVWKSDSDELSPLSCPSSVVADRPHSFGLHSPDTLPKTEDEFRAIASSFGLHSPDAAGAGASLPAPSKEKLHPSYNPRLFCDGGLYLDPDIIDLTLIPPPKTPEDEKLIDFSVTTMSSPPPGFSDESASSSRAGAHNTSTDSDDVPDLPAGIADLPTPIREKIDALVLNDEELGTQLAAIDALLLDDARFKKDAEKESGIESETDSGNETISSENVDLGWCDSFPSEIPGLAKVTEELLAVPPVPSDMSAMDDIDAFIQSMTVPPPPHDSPQEDITIPSPPKERSLSPPTPTSRLGSPPKERCPTPQNDRLPSPPKERLPSPPKERLPSPPQDRLPSPPKERFPSPPKERLPTPPRETVVTKQKSIDKAKNREEYPVFEDESTSPVAASETDEEFPPPPTPSTTEGLAASFDIDLSVVPPAMDLEDEYAKYIIPPPPESIDTSFVDSICIVPPVDIKTPSPEKDDDPSYFADLDLSRMLSKSAEPANEEEQIPSPPADTVMQAVVRPVQARSMSHQELGMTEYDDSKSKLPPPAPPQRLNSAEGGSLTNSPAGSASVSPENKYLDINAKYSSLLRRPYEIRSADSSPVHKGKAMQELIAGSTATLNRKRGAPPKPPPRRSSMPGVSITGEDSDSDIPLSLHTAATRSTSLDTSEDRDDPLSRLKHLEDQKSDYCNIFIGNQPAARLGSEPTLCMTETNGFSSFKKSPVGKRHTRAIEMSTLPREMQKRDATGSMQELRTGRSRKDQAKASPKLRTFASVDVAKTQKIFDEKASKVLDDKLEKSASDSKIQVQRAGSFRGSRSPSFQRKLLTFEVGANNPGIDPDNSSDSMDSDIFAPVAPPKSPMGMGRSSSSTFNSSSPKLFGPGSPKSSPLLNRHSSFSRMAERAISPLRNMFGGSSGSAEKDRLSISSESETSSGPPSPRRTFRAFTLGRSPMRPFGPPGTPQRWFSDKR